MAVPRAMRGDKAMPLWHGTAGKTDLWKIILDFMWGFVYLKRLNGSLTQ